MKHAYIYTLLFIISNLYSQDRTFLSINNSSISIDDFMKTYEKNRLDNDTLSLSASLEEYLNLYINFRLKVEEAKQLGLDTVPSFVRELEGYRKQLIKPYLTDTKVSDQLLVEAYERLKSEVSASHILIQVNGDDTLSAYKEIMDIRNQIMNGSDFVTLARKFSHDPSVKENDGNLGYFTALYMVYPFETAAYETEVGEVSQPIKTQFGYHILRVNDKRDSRGEVKVAHIMIRLDNKKDSINIFAAKQRIDEIYDSLILTSGENFTELAKKYSDDKKSGSKGGELDWFGANKMVKKFEDVAFSLDSIGLFSQPFQTEFGWHIVKLLDKKKLPSFVDLKESLRKKIERDSRSQKTRDVVINRLKNEWGFAENHGAKDIFYNLINQDFFEGGDILKNISGQGSVMFLFNNNYDNLTRYVYQKDFAEYLILYRARLPKKMDVKKLVNQFYKTFQEQKLLELESNNLEYKYDDFRLLMNEYHDGILLFNLSEEEVWNKAIKDTLGLRNFYKKNQKKYMWENRIEANIYSSKNNGINKRVYRNLNWGFSDQDLLNNMNKKSALNLSIENGIFEYGDNSIVDSLLFSLEWSSLKKGQIINCESLNKIVVIKNLFSTEIRPLNDVKGLVISDYQNFLDDQWLAKLKSKYSITINNNLFELAKKNKLSYNSSTLSSGKKFICNSFSSCFSIAGQYLGYSKDVYFGWGGRIYTTEIKP